MYIYTVCHVCSLNRTFACTVHRPYIKILHTLHGFVHVCLYASTTRQSGGQILLAFHRRPAPLKGQRLKGIVGVASICFAHTTSQFDTRRRLRHGARPFTSICIARPCVSSPHTSCPCHKRTPLPPHWALAAQGGPAQIAQIHGNIY